MKTSLLFGVMLAVLGAVIASTSAQTQSTTVQVSKLVGTKVKSSQGEEIGVVKDVMIDRSTGCMVTPFFPPAKVEHVLPAAANSLQFRGQFISLQAT
jgi:sporulation protein YlmC with PRC-barrel domain